MKLLLSRYKSTFVTMHYKRLNVNGTDYNVNRAPKDPAYHSGSGNELGKPFISVVHTPLLSLVTDFQMHMVTA